MLIEKNTEAGLYNIWVEKDETEYKKDVRYQEAVKECKAKGYTACVYVSGEIPIASIMEDALALNTGIA